MNRPAPTPVSHRLLRRRPVAPQTVPVSAKSHVHGYERDAADNPDDANQLRCSAEVEQGAFRVGVDASFTTDDFARLLSEMDRLMTGERPLRPLARCRRHSHFASRSIGLVGPRWTASSVRFRQAGRTVDADLPFLTKTRPS